MSLKTNPGNYFEDFETGTTLVHAVPRTITEGDQALLGFDHFGDGSDFGATLLGFFDELLERGGAIGGG